MSEEIGEAHLVIGADMFAKGRRRNGTRMDKKDEVVIKRSSIVKSRGTHFFECYAAIGC